MKKSYLLSSLLAAMFVSMPMSADVIGMRTNAAVGEKLSLALNENVKATLTWGNGDTEEVLFTGKELEITVKDAAFKLSSDQQVTRLFCPDCALTELDLKEAPNLLSLICPGNQLTTLKLLEAEKLLDLNCSDNQLTSVSLSKSLKLKNLNVSNNKFQTLSIPNLKELESLLCANNDLKTISLGNMKNLTTFWCQGNQMEKLFVSKDANLKQLCLFDNKFKEIDPEKLTDIQELWVDNNELTSLDLSATHIQKLSASNNKLTSILWNSKDHKSLTDFYVDGNQLTFTSLPTVYSTSNEDTLISYNVENQLPFFIEDTICINEKLDFASLTRRNAWGDFTRVEFSLKNAEGKALVEDVDYTKNSSSFTFNRPYTAVYVSATSVLYPNVVFSFAPFMVIDPTGIHGVNNESDFHVFVRGNQICVTSPVSVDVKVYTMSGTLAVNENMAAGTSSWTLPAGVYVVNGKKVVLGR